jgi:hypothetical protein
MESEPPVVKPPTNPEEDYELVIWANNWNNGKPRTLNPGQVDPYDNQVKLADVGSIKPKVIIDGKGKSSFSGLSPRLYIGSSENKTIKNCEFSAEFLVETGLTEIYLVVRSDHEIRPDGFGGYYGYFNFIEKKFYFKKELTHEKGYSSRLSEKSMNWPQGQWVKATMSVKNMADSRVKMIAGFNDSAAQPGYQVTTEFIDSGQLTCSNDNGTHHNTAPCIDTCSWCFFRVNKPVNHPDGRPGVHIRNAVIRSI